MAQWLQLHGWFLCGNTYDALPVLFQVTHISGVYPPRPGADAYGSHTRILLANAEFFVRETIEQVGMLLREPHIDGIASWDDAHGVQYLAAYDVYTQ